MRIKIDGPITIDRVERGFTEAKKMLGDTEAYFYCANIYVHVFDKHGRKIALPSGDPDKPDLHLHVDSEDQMWPVAVVEPNAATSADLQRKAEERRQKQAAAQQARREQKKKSAENQARLRSTLESSKSAFRQAVAKYESLLRILEPAVMAKELNAQIEQVWHDNSLIQEDGVQIKPMPYFLGLQDKVILSRGGRTDSIVPNIVMPFGHVTSEGYATPHWRYAEWRLAVQRMMVRLNEIAAMHGVPLFGERIVPIIVRVGAIQEEKLVWHDAAQQAASRDEVRVSEAGR